MLSTLKVSRIFCSCYTSYPISSTSYPISSTSYPISSTFYPISSTSYPISSTFYPISSTSRVAILTMLYKVANFRISNFRTIAFFVHQCANFRTIFSVHFFSGHILFIQIYPPRCSGQTPQFLDVSEKSGNPNTIDLIQFKYICSLVR